jgi:hypothetical protein
MRARYPVMVSLCLVLSACAFFEDRPYTQWRAFHAGVAAMNTAEREERLAQLQAQEPPQASALVALQQAYLLTVLEPDTRTGQDPDAEIGGLLDSVDDDHVLVPIRDMLRDQLAIRQQQGRDRGTLATLQRQCDALQSEFQAALREQASLQRLGDTCREQLEALKEIESVMSAEAEEVERRP